ncbi:MAG: SDR family oxidoreductase [Candidatus Omnitrophica bacterium]|nr:SDR family oxidoreductase [Candidatus Omnitrophota bacterium]
MNKTAVVIGGSGGIGTAVSEKMIQKGIKVYSSYQKEKPNNPDINFFKVEINEIDSVKGEFSKILDKEKIDIMVFSVTAKIENKQLMSLQWADYSKHIDVQIKGLYNTFDALKEQLRSKHKTKFIILLTEYCAGRPSASLSHYITAKYGLMGMAKSMAVELARYNCTVNMVSPGMTSTDLISNLPPKLIEITAANNPLKRIAKPEDVANVVLFLAGDESDYINGANIFVNGGGVIV